MKTNKNQKIVLEYSPSFFDIILGGRVPDPAYVQSQFPSIPAKGWRNIAPRTRGERQELMDKCGPDCFLDSSSLRYPICSKLNDCKPHCSGILSAKIRSGQWKEPEIYQKAEVLWNKNC